MQTTLTIKTDKKLRDDAKKTDEELGVPLTTIVNSMLKQFVREQAVVLTTYPTPKASKLREWAKISDDMDKHPEKYKVYNSVEEYLAHLDAVWKKADRKRK